MHARSMSRTLAVGAALTLALFASACGSDSTSTTDSGSTSPSGSGSGSTVVPTTVTPTTAATSGTALGTTAFQSGDDASANVKVIDTKHGKILANQQGKALYIFEQDTTNVGSCSGGCAQKWPPATVEEETVIVGSGLQASTFGTITRADGSTQLTVGGKPVYTMAAENSGEILCQGGDDVWWLVNPDGSVNKT